eukprot:2075062-Rhodomonas_salina.1
MSSREVVADLDPVEKTLMSPTKRLLHRLNIQDKDNVDVLHAIREVIFLNQHEQQHGEQQERVPINIRSALPPSIPASLLFLWHAHTHRLKKTSLFFLLSALHCTFLFSLPCHDCTHQHITLCQPHCPSPRSRTSPAVLTVLSVGVHTASRKGRAEGGSRHRRCGLSGRGIIGGNCAKWRWLTAASSGRRRCCSRRGNTPSILRWFNAADVEGVVVVVLWCGRTESGA